MAEEARGLTAGPLKVLLDQALRQESNKGTTIRIFPKEMKLPDSRRLAHDETPGMRFIHSIPIPGFAKGVTDFFLQAGGDLSLRAAPCTPAHLSEGFLTSFLESNDSDCIVKNSADLPKKSKVSFLSTRVEQYDSNGARIFLKREGTESDIPNAESDLVLTFKAGDIVNKKIAKYLEGVDLIQLESTGRSKYVFLFNLVVGWRKK